MKSNLRNGRKNCETAKRYFFSRFNAVKHGGYASSNYFTAIANNERLQQRKQGRFVDKISYATYQKTA
ncbi:hypothetical protein [Histophilus somni]|uniref:hypothetical protein n=1 Tax=Histophilus somni TaxID=731 RepID=UPI00201EBA58|nr:hypothetical protein [Histophilus somni]